MAANIVADPLSNEELIEDHSDTIEEDVMAAAKETNCFMRDTIIALHRASMNSDEDIRQSSLNSLVEMVKQDPVEGDVNLGMLLMSSVHELVHI